MVSSLSTNAPAKALHLTTLAPTSTISTFLVAKCAITALKSFHFPLHELRASCNSIPSTSAGTSGRQP
jgi:hypothetical protein